jgi:hypothetical protein
MNARHRSTTNRGLATRTIVRPRPSPFPKIQTAQATGTVSHSARELQCSRTHISKWSEVISDMRKMAHWLQIEPNIPILVSPIHANASNALQISLAAESNYNSNFTTEKD